MDRARRSVSRCDDGDELPFDCHSYRDVEDRQLTEGVVDDQHRRPRAGNVIEANATAIQISLFGLLSIKIFISSSVNKVDFPIFERTAYVCSMPR